MSKPKIERNIQVPMELIEELLTDSEVRMVKQRLMIIRLLEEGNTVRSIAEQVQVGTDTVVRMARRLENSAKLREAFRRYQSENKSSAQWVFGKTKV